MDTRVKLTIEGTQPILFNRFTAESELAVAAGRTTAIKSKKKLSREEQAHLKCYTTEDGTLYFPGPNLLACLINAGKFHKIGRNKVTTTTTSLVPAALEVRQEIVSFGTKNFLIDERRVVNGSTGGAQLACRGRLDPGWRLTFEIYFDSSMFDESLVRDLVDDGGTKIGIGDYRPSRKGPFGKFKVVHWEATPITPENI